MIHELRETYNKMFCLPVRKIYNSNSFYLIENNYNLENVKKRALKQKIYFIPIINNNEKVINLLTSRDLFSEKKKQIHLCLRRRMCGTRSTVVELHQMTQLSCPETSYLTPRNP